MAAKSLGSLLNLKTSFRFGKVFFHTSFIFIPMLSHDILSSCAQPWCVSRNSFGILGVNSLPRQTTKGLARQFMFRA